MNNKKINKIIFTMIGLTAFSGALFGYDMYLNNQTEEKIIYVAKQDIPAQTTLKKDMFEPVSIPAQGALPVYVTDLNEIAGKQLKGGILKSEPLSKNRLTTENDLTNNLQIKIEADESSIDVNDNDFINLYVILNINGELQIRKVFDTKKINLKTVSSGDSVSSIITMKVNEEEVNKYLDAKERGKIIIVKNNSLDGNKDVAEYDPTSEEVKNSTKPVEDNDDNGNPTVAVVTKTFEEGDTLEDLAIKYKTNVDSIKKLNNNKQEFNVGDEIILPAN